MAILDLNHLGIGLMAITWYIYAVALQLWPPVLLLSLAIAVV